MCNNQEIDLEKAQAQVQTHADQQHGDEKLERGSSENDSDSVGDNKNNNSSSSSTAQHAVSKTTSRIAAEPATTTTTSRTTSNSLLDKALALVRTRVSDPNPGPPPDGGFVAWSQVALSHLVLANTWGYVNAFGVFQTYYTSHLHESPSTISWIGGFQTFLTFFIGTFSGRATDAGYFKFTWGCGMFLVTLSLFLTSLCTEYWQIFLSQALLQGIGSGLMFCPTVALLPTYFTTKRALAISSAAAGSATGGLIIPAMVNALIPKIGFAWTMRCLGFFTLGTLLPCLFFLRSRLPPRATGPIIELQAFKEMPYLCFGFGMFFLLWGLYVGFFYISSYAKAALGVSTTTSTDLLMVMSAVGFPARIIPGLISDTWTGPLNLLIPFGLATAVTSFGWTGVVNLPGVVAWSVIYGIVSAAVQGLFPVALSSLTDDLKKTGVRMGMVLSIISFAALTGTPIAGALVSADNHGKSYLYMQMFMGSVITLGTFFIILSRVTRFGFKVVKG